MFSKHLFGVSVKSCIMSGSKPLGTFCSVSLLRAGGKSLVLPSVGKGRKLVE